MSNKKIVTETSKETKEFAAEFAKQILQQKPAKEAVALALSGNLGAGKTTFVQGFAKGLGIKEVVNSPTFVIVKGYKIQGTRYKKFYHIDCYRLEDEKDLEVLGFKEIISNPENIVAIEWPERISKILPEEEMISVIFTHLKNNKRNLIIKQ